jgi:hypothetical protein
MKTYEEWRYSSTIHDLDTSEREWSASLPGNFTPEGKPAVPIGQEADWAVVYRKSLASVGNRTPASSP